jgi:hypothetical protein
MQTWSWACPTLTAYAVTLGSNGEPRIRPVPVKVESSWQQ